MHQEIHGLAYFLFGGGRRGSLKPQFFLELLCPPLQHFCDSIENLASEVSRSTVPSGKRLASRYNAIPKILATGS